jgi:hypothetical protein
MEKKVDDKESLLSLIKEAIELLCEKSISEVVILSSYKISSVLSDNYGIDIRVDKIGRILSNFAKRNELKRLRTNIPKFKLRVSMVSSLSWS